MGYLVNYKGLRPTEKKMLVIKEVPDPKNVTKLKSFVGLLKYYRRLLPNISTTLQPLYVLLQNMSWRWNGKPGRLSEAKEKLLRSGFLTHYDLEKPTKLTCDASPCGVGDCLIHVVPDGHEQPAAFASRKLTPAETGYTQIEREDLVLILESATSTNT